MPGIPADDCCQTAITKCPKDEAKTASISFFLLNSATGGQYEGNASFLH